MNQSMPAVRQPVVAGQFYPGDAAQLNEAVRRLIGAGPVQKALGVMVPHAGYVYSGRVAGEVYGRLEPPEIFIILGPNHTGLGPPAAIMTSGIWKMPTGDVAIDEKMAADITASSGLLEDSAAAHVYEHSIEVQLPFLQYLVEQPKIVPICLMPLTAGQCRDIGLAIAGVVKSSGKQILVIASSDMSHYEAEYQARRQDEMALKQIMRLDGAGLLQTVRDNQISMCGAAPVAVMLYACKELGATSAKLVKYETSGDVTGDFRQVVGYAGLVVS